LEQGYDLFSLRAKSGQNVISMEKMPIQKSKISLKLVLNGKRTGQTVS